MVKAGGEPRAGPRFRVRRVRSGSAQGRARADLGPRPRTAPSAPGTPGAASRSLSPARPRPGLVGGAGGPEGLGERGAVTSGRGCRTRSVSAAARRPRGGRLRCRTPRHPRGVGGSRGARARGRGAGSGQRAPRRPRGRPAGTPARGAPKVGVAGRARRTLYVPEEPRRRPWTRKSRGPLRSFKVAAAPPGGGNR